MYCLLSPSFLQEINMNDTIAAISTAVTEAGIGIVRISGPLSTEILCRIFRPKKEKDLRSLPSHTIHYGYIMDQDVMIDEVLVMYMKGPHTYTGEDTVEIDCHGGIYSVRRVLETVLSNGARIAEPGEFTKRAFLSGRLDLSQAEAVMDVIRAKNEYALESSLQQLKGSLREAVTGIRSRLLYQIAYIEIALDDPEHYDLSGYPEELLAVIDEEEKNLRELLSHSSDGRILQEGIRAAQERYHADAIYVEAQTYARGLYEKQGFRQILEEFLEDGIPHVRMLKEL